MGEIFKKNSPFSALIRIGRDGADCRSRCPVSAVHGMGLRKELSTHSPNKIGIIEYMINGN